MDCYFPDKLLGEIFWDEPLLATDQSDLVNGEASPPASIQSAFVRYRYLPGKIHSLNGSNSQIMTKRMLAYMRKSWPVERNNVEENERDRSFRHMINERMRRQRQRQCCLDLHSLLPQGTKTDNNSVIQMAAKEIVRLQRKKVELEANFEGGGFQYLIVPHPNSAIDSMVETLKGLKDQGLDTRSIKSTFSPEAVLEMKTDVQKLYVG